MIADHWSFVVSLHYFSNHHKFFVVVLNDGEACARVKAQGWVGFLHGKCDTLPAMAGECAQHGMEQRGADALAAMRWQYSDCQGWYVASEVCLISEQARPNSTCNCAILEHSRQRMVAGAAAEGIDVA